MPRFDNIAMAAMTPGGFNAGVNDMVQAILGAKANSARMAQQQEQQSWERGFKEKSLGQEMANSLANRELREREVKANELRAQTDYTLAGNKVADTWADNIGSVGKYLGDKLMPNAKAGGGATPANELSREKFDYEKNKDVEEQIRRKANLDAGLSADGQYEEVEQSPIMKNVAGMPLMDPKTKEYLRDTSATKYVKRMATPEKAKMAEENYRKAMAARTTSLPSSGVVSARTQTNTGDTNGLSQNEAPKPGGMGSQVAQTLGGQAPAPAIDYAAWDAKLQASDPEYRQLRSNPQFDWKADIADGIAKGDYK